MEGLYKNKYRIQTTRLRGYDYGSSGYYFITICTHKRVHYFGRVMRDGPGDVFVGLSDIGCVVRDEIIQTPVIRPNVRLDEWIIMPNHVHMIIEITSQHVVETPRRGVSTDAINVPIKKPRNPNHRPEWKPGVLGAIINQFKSIVTKKCKTLNHPFQWQPRYYDHIIRNERALRNIRRYIKQNPYAWHRDRNNVANVWY